MIGYCWVWFDNNKKKDVAWKINNAAMHYYDKFGQYPTKLYLSSTPAEPIMIDKQTVAIEVQAFIKADHFWFALPETNVTDDTSALNEQE